MRASVLILPALVAALGLNACDPGGSAPAETQQRAPDLRQTPAPQSPPPAFTPPQLQPNQPVAEPPPPPLLQGAPKGNGRLPLSRILDIARQRVAGEVIDVDLDEDDDDDTAVYKLEILTPEGRAIEMELDARTGAVLDIEED